MSWMKPVFSSVASDVGFDSDTKELLVRWKNGRTSAYAGVPEEVAQDLANTASVGGMLNDEIKNNYRHRYK